MATIALYSNYVNQMPTLIKEVKNAVVDYRTELSALKKQVLTISNSICNMSEVITSIQAATQTQEQKIDSINELIQNNEDFITEVVRIDQEVGEVIQQRKEEFYTTYTYLKPECEKDWLEKADEWLDSSAEWCKKRFKSFLNCAKIVLEAVMSFVLTVADLGKGFGVSTLKNLLEIINVIFYPGLIIDEYIRGGRGNTRQIMEEYDRFLERLLAPDPRRITSQSTYYLGRCIGDYVSIAVGAIGMAEGILAAITGTETGVLISLTGQLEVSIPVTITIDAVGVIVAGLSLVFAIESIKNLEADQANYRQSRIDESRSSDNLGSGTEGGSTTASDWENRIPELSKQAPVDIPSDATVKIQTKNGYDQITFKWSENGYNYEVRWHTRTPGAPAEQGNTWVVSRVTPGTPTGQVRAEHILVGDTWVPGYQWQDAINAYSNGTATAEQLQLLMDGHWSAP